GVRRVGEFVGRERRVLRHPLIERQLRQGPQQVPALGKDPEERAAVPAVRPEKFPHPPPAGDAGGGDHARRCEQVEKLGSGCHLDSAQARGDQGAGRLA
ncbi:MAG: hypothetical protein J5654_04915, partial [Victivallales bacterium]|nr:hypothetical protein [Victivallales bacterium]